MTEEESLQAFKRQQINYAIVTLGEVRKRLPVYGWDPKAKKSLRCALGKVPMDLRAPLQEAFGEAYPTTEAFLSAVMPVIDSTVESLKTRLL